MCLGNQLTSVSESDYDADGNINSRFSTTNTYDRRGNILTSVFEYDSDGDGKIDFREETLYEYLNGSKYVIGFSTEELEVFSDNSINSQVDPLSEEFTLPFSVSSDVM
ncbi:hypothetical protein IQ238_28590 [Pleurocapsales cyanobacterium LEGE 06147]|nr:hypothetical protein [Pleurocapsales cyanobacterium LEGE 06147]